MSRENNFRRFEKTIQSAIEAYPTPVKIEHSTLSPASLATQIRNAKKFLKDIPSTTTVIDTVSFLKLYSSLQVFVVGDTTYLGQKSSLSNSLVHAADHAAPVYAGDRSAESITPSQLTMLLSLYNDNVFTAPYKITRPDNVFIETLKSIAKANNFRNINLRLVDNVIYLT